MTDKKSVSLILSATVMLGRNGSDSLEIFMVRRNRAIDFASGALVFPGGKVEAQDRCPALLNDCDGKAGMTEMEISLRVAAIRESFEESGIFLARHRETGRMISGEPLGELTHYRKRLASGEMSLETLLRQEGLLLACDTLVPFARWITPELMPKRFDTTFFLAMAPQDHIGLHDGSESVDSLWIAPEKAIQMADSGEFSMLFPTRMNLLKLAKSRTMEEALDAARSQNIKAIMPWVEERSGKMMLCIPEDQGYPVTSESLKKVMGDAASR